MSRRQAGQEEEGEVEEMFPLVAHHQFAEEGELGREYQEQLAKEQGEREEEEKQSLLLAQALQEEEQEVTRREEEDEKVARQLGERNLSQGFIRHIPKSNSGITAFGTSGIPSTTEATVALPTDVYDDNFIEEQRMLEARLEGERRDLELARRLQGGGGAESPRQIIPEKSKAVAYSPLQKFLVPRSFVQSSKPTCSSSSSPTSSHIKAPTKAATSVSIPASTEICPATSKGSSPSPLHKFLVPRSLNLSPMQGPSLPTSKPLLSTEQFNMDRGAKLIEEDLSVLKEENTQLKTEAQEKEEDMRLLKQEINELKKETQKQRHTIKKVDDDAMEVVLKVSESLRGDLERKEEEEVDAACKVFPPSSPKMSPVSANDNLQNIKTSSFSESKATTSSVTSSFSPSTSTSKMTVNTATTSPLQKFLVPRSLNLPSKQPSNPPPSKHPMLTEKNISTFQNMIVFPSVNNEIENREPSTSIVYNHLDKSTPENSCNTLSTSTISSKNKARSLSEDVPPSPTFKRSKRVSSLPPPLVIQKLPKVDTVGNDDHESCPPETDPFYDTIRKKQEEEDALFALQLQLETEAVTRVSPRKKGVTLGKTTLSKPSKRCHKKHRSNACNACTHCLRPNCGRCAACRDMRRFGGRGTGKQRCEGRRCGRPVVASCNLCATK